MQQYRVRYAKCLRGVSRKGSRRDASVNRWAVKRCGLVCAHFTLGSRGGSMRKGMARRDRACRQTPVSCGVCVLGAALAVLTGTSPASALVTEAGGAEYIAICEANGVAIPTVVDTTGNNGWIKKSELFPDLLRSRGSFGLAEVYYWTHPEGTVCLA